MKNLNISFYSTIINAAKKKCANKDCNVSQYCRLLLANEILTSREIFEKYCVENKLDPNWLEPVKVVKTIAEMKAKYIYKPFKMVRKTPDDFKNKVPLEFKVEKGVSIDPEILRLYKDRPYSSAFWIQFLMMKDLSTNHMPIWFMGDWEFIETGDKAKPYTRSYFNLEAYCGAE